MIHTLALAHGGDFFGVIEEEMEQRTDAKDFTLIDRGSGGQEQGSLAKGVGMWHRSWEVFRRTVVRGHAVAARKKVPAGKDSFGVKGLDEKIAREKSGGLVDFNHDVLEITPFFGGVRKESKAAAVAKKLTI